MEIDGQKGKSTDNMRKSTDNRNVTCRTRFASSRLKKICDGRTNELTNGDWTDRRDGRNSDLDVLRL